MGRVSPAPDAAQRDAAHQLQLNRRMREVEASILSRAPEHDLEPSLDRVRAVMELLGDPQRTFPVIHVTGTNGKTSTARIIEALLRELGLNTGRFTSPHLHSMLERIAVGGQQVSLRGLAAEYPDLFLPLHGSHQAQNAAVAVAAVEAFLGGGEQALDIEVVRAGLATVDSPGRLEIVRRSPTVLVDAAHKPAGARALRDAIQDSFTFARLVGVVAVMKDKDAAELLEALEPVLDEVVVTRTSSPRAMSPRQLGEIAVDIFGEHRVVIVDELPDALDRAAGMADEGGGVTGGVLATGSVVTAAEVRMLLGTTAV